MRDGDFIAPKSTAQNLLLGREYDSDLQSSIYNTAGVGPFDVTGVESRPFTMSDTYARLLLIIIFSLK